MLLVTVTADGFSRAKDVLTADEVIKINDRAINFKTGASGFSILVTFLEMIILYMNDTTI